MDWFIDGVGAFFSWITSYRLPYVGLTMIDIAIICLLVGIVAHFVVGGDDE